MKIKSMKTHGCGPHYSIEFKLAKFLTIRLWMGGYGNLKRSRGGLFTLIPRVIHYHRTATHICFLNMGLTFSYTGY